MNCRERGEEGRIMLRKGERFLSLFSILETVVEINEEVEEGVNQQK